MGLTLDKILGYKIRYKILFNQLEDIAIELSKIKEKKTKINEQNISGLCENIEWS